MTETFNETQDFNQLILKVSDAEENRNFQIVQAVKRLLDYTYIWELNITSNTPDMAAKIVYTQSAATCHTHPPAPSWIL